MTDAVQPRVKALSITLERCAKTFPDGTCALQPLDLHIEAGETVVLLGLQWLARPRRRAFAPSEEE